MKCLYYSLDNAKNDQILLSAVGVSAADELMRNAEQLSANVAKFVAHMGESDDVHGLRALSKLVGSVSELLQKRCVCKMYRNDIVKNINNKKLLINNVKKIFF